MAVHGSPIVEYLERGDFNYSSNRTIMLPAPSREAERRGDLAEGIALIANLLAYLHEVGEARRVLVVGHTDSVGASAYNLELAALRAENVYCFLVGDRSGWASHSRAHAHLADEQELLRWAANHFGWQCDPGPIDGIHGPKTDAARSGFRAHAQQWRAHAGVSPGALDHADWEVLFDLIEYALAARLAVARTDLTGLRAELVFADPPILACGERWPKHGVAHPAGSRADRRVELLLFRPDEVPASLVDDDPPGGRIYTPLALRWQAIPRGPDALHGGPCFEIGLAIDERPLVAQDTTLRLSGGPYHLRHRFADSPYRQGYWSFHFHAITKGVRYSLDYEPPDTDPVTLFTDADLDAYIDAIGVADAELGPVACARLPLDEPPRLHGPDLALGPIAPDDLLPLDELDIELLAPLDDYIVEGQGPP